MILGKEVVGDCFVWYPCTSQPPTHPLIQDYKMWFYLQSLILSTYIQCLCLQNKQTNKQTFAMFLYCVYHSLLLSHSIHLLWENKGGLGRRWIWFKDGGILVLLFIFLMINCQEGLSLWWIPMGNTNCNPWNVRIEIIQRLLPPAEDALQTVSLLVANPLALIIWKSLKEWKKCIWKIKKCIFKKGIKLVSSYPNTWKLSLAHIQHFHNKVNYNRKCCTRNWKIEIRLIMWVTHICVTYLHNWAINTHRIGAWQNIKWRMNITKKR